MEGVIRKIVIGRDPKDAMAYYVGMRAGSGNVSAIVMDEEHLFRFNKKRYLVYLQTDDGQVIEPYSISAGLDYPGIGQSDTYPGELNMAALAEIIGKYVNKGDPVMITGKMKSRKYTGKDGTEKESWELTANELQMLGGKRDQSEQSPAQQAHSEAKANGYQPDANSKMAGGFDTLDSDIPFSGMRGKMLNCI